VRHPSAGLAPVKQQVDVRWPPAWPRGGTSWAAPTPRRDRDRDDIVGAPGGVRFRCCSDLPRRVRVAGTIPSTLRIVFGGAAAHLPLGQQAQGDVAEPEADRVGRRGPRPRHGVSQFAPTGCHYNNRADAACDGCQRAWQKCEHKVDMRSLIQL
jgi:hypothetical protein